VLTCPTIAGFQPPPGGRGFPPGGPPGGFPPPR
jgi:hypothetical protein